jgi:hypothetical protein
MYDVIAVYGVTLCPRPIQASLAAPAIFNRKVLPVLQEGRDEGHGAAQLLRCRESSRGCWAGPAATGAAAGWFSGMQDWACPLMTSVRTGFPAQQSTTFAASK